MRGLRSENRVVGLCDWLSMPHSPQLSLSLQLVLHIYTYECMYVCTRFTDRKKFYGQYNIIIIKLYAQVVSGLRSRVPLDCAKEHNDRKKK